MTNPPLLRLLRLLRLPAVLLFLLTLEAGSGNAQPGCEWRWIDGLGKCPVSCGPPHFCPCYWCPE